MPVKRLADAVVKSDLTGLGSKSSLTKQGSLVTAAPRASKGMSMDRKIGAAFIIAGHIFALWGIVRLCQMPLASVLGGSRL